MALLITAVINIFTGGMFIVMLSPWASHVIGWGQDALLGHWSYLKMVGQHGKCAILVSAYRVCKQEFDATTRTSMAQQTCLLMSQGISNPNPCQQFITDLIKQILQWRTQEKEIFISMDANEDVDDPKSKIGRIFNETDLVDLHHHHHPATRKPATYQQGSHPINMMIGTPLFMTALNVA